MDIVVENAHSTVATSLFLVIKNGLLPHVIVSRSCLNCWIWYIESASDPVFYYFHVCYCLNDTLEDFSSSCGGPWSRMLRFVFIFRADRHRSFGYAKLQTFK